MDRAEIQAIELEGFRSYRSRVMVAFDPSSGLKYLTGQNQVTPRLEANGAGKTSLWLAMAWCITGVLPRGLRIGDVLSWGKSSMTVSTEWLVNGELHVITRAGPPERLTLNGKTVRQQDIDWLLRTSPRRFFHTVLFGQGADAFPDLSNPERSALFDEIMDLDAWLRRSDAAKKDANKATLARIDLERDMARLEGRLEGLGSLEELRTRADAWQAAQDARIDKSIQEVEQAEAGLLEARQTLDSRKAALAELPALDNLRKTIQRYQKQIAEFDAEYKMLFAKQRELQERSDLYAKEALCPTCGQQWTREHRTKHRDTLQVSVGVITGSIQTLNGRTGAARRQCDAVEANLRTAERKHTFLEEQVRDAEFRIRQLKDRIDAGGAMVERMMEEDNPHAARIHTMEDEQRKVEQARQALAADIAARNADTEVAEFWQKAFQRIRLFQTRRVLAQLEIQTTTEAWALGLTNWKVTYATERENKSGTFGFGIHILITPPGSEQPIPWPAWSGGEKQRLRRAISIAFAELIQRMCGVSYGLEVWDEPSAGLTSGGIQDLLQTLATRAEQRGKAIWVVDHAALAYSGFEEVWRVVKTDAGSTVVRVNATEQQQ